MVNNSSKSYDTCRHCGDKIVQTNNHRGYCLRCFEFSNSMKQSSNTLVWLALVSIILFWLGALSWVLS